MLSALGGNAQIAQFLPMILMFAILYFLILRPQQKKQKDHQEMLNSVKKGDEIVTSGGIVARVVRVNKEDNTLDVEISNDVKIKIQRQAIAAITKQV